MAMSNNCLKSQGLVSVRDLWLKAQGYARHGCRVLPVSEPPGADPHAGWCGEGRLEAGPYPIGPLLTHSVSTYVEHAPFFLWQRPRTQCGAEY
jgi:hypothetical protein